MNKIVCTFLLAIYYFLLITPANAADFSAGVSPSVIYLNASPGETVSANLEIENFSEHAFTFSHTFREFGVSTNDDSQINLIQDSADFLLLRPNLKLMLDGQAVERFMLSPKSKQRLVLKTEIPITASIRDNYFTLLFVAQQVNPQSTLETSSSLIQPGLGINVILSIGEAESASLFIEEFSAPVFIKKGPVPFKLKVRNPGTHFITPKGSIRIYNFFGQLIGKIEIPRMNILSASSRTYFNDYDDKINNNNIYTNVNKYIINAKHLYWPEKFLAGPYKAELTIALSNKPAYSRSVYFFSLPYQEILIGIVILCTLVFIKKRIKRYLSA